MDYELPIKIPVGVFGDYINCTVCMSVMEHVYMTPCGHRFCEKCIRECINRHHRCPCCNAALQQGDLVQDRQFDELINTFTVEKEKAEADYFERLTASGGSDNTAGASGSENEEFAFTPIEKVLKNHLKQSLLLYQRYFEELQNDYKHRLSQVETELSQLSQAHCLSSHELDQLRTRLQTSQNELQEQKNTCTDLVVQAYDRYLSEHIPTITMLSVKVSARLYGKDVFIPDILIAPQDTKAEIVSKIREHLKETPNEVVDIRTSSHLVYFSPFSKCSAGEMDEITMDLIMNGTTNANIFILPDRSRPVLQFGLKPGGELVLHGAVCKPDLPKVCFVSTYVHNQQIAVDYFTCKDCAFNWVCRSCMECCHKDHDTIPYIMNHHPTWACCYCPKKKKCQLQSGSV